MTTATTRTATATTTTTATTATDKTATTTTTATTATTTATAATAVPAETSPEKASFKVSTAADPEGGSDWVSVTITLPGLTSAGQASLEVSETSIKVDSLNDAFPHSLSAPLPVKVDPDTSAAKWSKRSQQLTVRLRAL
eukprot:TRINITY_DN3121_c0_g1_i3.p2 TRINITY_DN3121_c0_g1~~TRINITY_DN3121_c0_g1_i3.p2  ORF type:complete len:148 (-),score=46.38 TRINITY_DN3121_c0_g1_i3:251-667(-)